MIARRRLGLPSSSTGFTKLTVHGYPLAIYQCARVPLEFSNIILKKKTCSINPKPRLKTKEKGFFLNLNKIWSTNSIEDQKTKKGLLRNLKGILSPNLRNMVSARLPHN